MMPGNALSPILEYAPFLYPDNIPVFNTTDYELGGIGLADASQGLQVQAWFLQITGPVSANNVVISSSNTSPTVLFTAPDVTEVSLSFDQNMRPAVAYVSAGNSYFWWYDTTIPGYTVITLTGATNPRCTLDDKRAAEISLGLSDIILAYLKGTNLYIRQQRDRFTIEYFLKDLSTLLPNPSLNKIGMNSIPATGRLQFQIFGNLWA